MGSVLLEILAFLLIILSAEPFAWTAPAEGLFVSQIAMNPYDSKNLYVLTTYSIGVLKTTDGGQDWTQINQGIRSYSLYQLTVHPKNPNILYLGAGGAGLYKSSDGGTRWMEMNDGLQNTDIGMLVLHPNDPETVYVVTSTGLFKSPDGGKSWIALNQGDNFTESQQFQSLIVLPTAPPTFFLASKKGLYTRKEDDAGWRPVGGVFEGKQISTLARDPRTGRLYAAVLRRGTLETLHEGGLFTSPDGGKSWSRLGEELAQDWIREILIDPRDFRTLYLATSGRGVLKSVDGGESWKEINVGLANSDRDIHSLVIDPHDPQVLYAGSHGDWVSRSPDAGQTWERLPLGPHQTSQQILADLNREGHAAQRESKIEPPAVFQKCNRCHGWTDLSINRGSGSWRVSANRRDWVSTVKRMSKGASLTPEEEVRIAEFLNDYTKADKTKAMQDIQTKEIQVSVLEGREEEDPVIAWDGKNYMAVWQTNRKNPDDYDVYATRIDPEGKVLDPQGISISDGPSNQIFADIIAGNGQYLVVWQDLRSRQRWEIYGARIRFDGKLLDPQGIPIATGERNAQYPKVAWNQKNFLVVWMEENEGRGWDIAGKNISPEGKVIDRDRFSIARGPGDQTHPALACGGNQCLVAWMDHPPAVSPRISGTRLADSGEVLDPEGLVLSRSSGDPAYPAVAWGQDRFVVIWSDQPTSGGHALSGVQVSFSGETVNSTPFMVARSSNPYAFPSVKCSGENCLVVWEEDQSHGGTIRGIEDIIRDVRGAFLDLSHPVVTSRQEVMIADKAVGNHFAQVASDSQSYLVVWKDYRTGTAASLGRFVTPP